MQNTSKIYGVEKKRLSTQTLVKVSILAVMGFMLMLLNMPLPIFPGFLKIDLSDVPALVGAFALGPVAGVLIQLVKVLLHFITKTTTGGVGELSNFIVGVAYVVPAALIYQRKKDRKHAIIGVIVGTIVMGIAGALSNMYIIIPFYSNMMPIDAIVRMGTAINSNITDVNSLVILGIVPFNLFKGIVIGLVTMLIYKKISPILKNQ